MADMTYYIASGHFYIGAKKLTNDGYAGYLDIVADIDYRNDPAFSCIKDKGPLPPGLYTMYDGKNHITKNSIKLEPLDVRMVCGRDNFYIHGGNAAGTASQGCIILFPQDRKMVFDAMKSGISILEVKTGLSYA